jgi:hypothetical protein
MPPTNGTVGAHRLKRDHNERRGSLTLEPSRRKLIPLSRQEEHYYRAWMPDFAMVADVGRLGWHSQVLAVDDEGTAEPLCIARGTHQWL